MRQSYSRAVLAAALLLITPMVTAQTTTASADLKPIQTLSCYKNVSTLTEYQEYQYATDGWCQEQCGGMNHPVMALTGGSTCYCGDEIPAADQIVSESNCNSPCNGYDQKNCGGLGFFQVYLTGLTTNVDTAANSTSSSSSSSSGSSTSSASPSIVTKAGETVVVTASSVASASASSGGTNKIGIAVGVVVGIIAASAIVGFIIFYLKQRRRRAIEEEHKRSAAVAEFVSGKSEVSSAHTDQRLDATIFSHRRESVGSIADEMDYSRRILQVRNPDYRSSQLSTVG